MFERPTDARKVVFRRAGDEARRLGSVTVEAEHLLLALTQDTGAAGTMLTQAGLDHDALDSALVAENEQSLAAVGVSLAVFDLPPMRSQSLRRPRLGTSGKRALERATRAALARGDRRIESAHILLGLVRAQAGTIPRALDLAGVDQYLLAARAEAILDHRV
jgi:ATP-dependent Clp protease ATP-binding subunit ClpA